MTEPPASPRARPGPALLYAVFAAALLTALDWGSLLLTLPIAGSDALGMLAYLLCALSLHLAWLFLPAWAVTWLADRLERRDRAAPAAGSLALLLTALLLLLGAAITERLLPSGQNLQFAEHLGRLRFTLLALGTVFVLVLVRFWLEPLLSAWLARRERPSARGVLAALLGVTGLAAALVVPVAMAPVHLDRLAPPFVLLSGMCFAGLLRTLLPPVQLPPTRPLAIAVATLFALTLGLLVRDDHGRFLLFAHAPLSAPMARLVRDLSDFDGDGATATLLGGADCAPFDGNIGPAQHERAGDGIDQDCRGGDGAARARPHTPAGMECAEKPVQGVVLVTIDAMRADLMGGAATPSMSRFAAQALTFERAYAPATFTFKSFASLFGMTTLSDTSETNPLAAGQKVLETSFVARLQAAGLRTGFVNFIGFEPVLRAGFEEQNRTLIDNFAGDPMHELSSAKTTNAGLEFLDRHKQERFFLWLHYADAHAPYRNPHFSDATADALPPYARAVAYVDLHVGRLLAGMAQRGLATSTAIFITADHGEDLGEHGGHLGHGPDLYESVVHVPLIAWLPGCRPRHIAEPRSTVELGPTVGALTGVPMAGLRLLDARAESLPVVSEALYDEGAYPPRTFMRSIVLGKHKLIVDVRNGGRVLFDLADDAAESFDLYRAEPAIAGAMEAAYQGWLDRPRTPKR